VWEGTGTLSDIGGLGAIKEFLTRICNGNDAPATILFMDEIEKAYAGTGTDTSGVKTELTGRMLSWTQDKEIDGMIWIGVPGGGKSQLVKNTGNEFNKQVISFDLAGMQGSLVGQSGANLRSAQATVDAISGGKILMIATCNSINSLPPELRRRFNLGIFFFDVPSAEERKGIWTIYREKYHIDSKDVTPDDHGWTGAEIKECCKKAYRLKISLTDAAKYIVPVTQSSAELIDNLRRSSNGKYLSATIPGVYKYTEQETEVQDVPAPARRMKS
jgi:SpoVK/Ycf46/Vps4 family AAA+-type ATPase